MTMTLDINVPQNLNWFSKSELQTIVSALLKDYNEMDLKLLKKYLEVKDLPNDSFINI